MSFIGYFYVRGTPPELSNGILEIQTIDLTSNLTLNLSLDSNRFNTPGRYSIINYNSIVNGNVSNIRVFSSNFNVSNIISETVSGFVYPNMIKVDLT